MAIRYFIKQYYISPHSYNHPLIPCHCWLAIISCFNNYMKSLAGGGIFQYMKFYFVRVSFVRSTLPGQFATWNATIRYLRKIVFPVLADSFAASRISTTKTLTGNALIIFSDTQKGFFQLSVICNRQSSIANLQSIWFPAFYI